MLLKSKLLQSDGPILRASPSSIPVGQNKRKALLNSRCPLRGHRVYEGKNNNDTHCCSTQGQLCPTWQSYEGLPPEEGACVTFYTLESLERGAWRREISGLRSARNDKRAAERPGFRGFKRFKGFRGEGIALRAISIKSALRDYLLCLQCCMT